MPFSVFPVVTQNWIQAWPPDVRLPLLPFSTVSMENVAICALSLHVNAWRWLSHHAAAVLLEP